MVVYVVTSAELDYRDCVIGVFTDLEEAYKCETYYQSVKGIGGIRIENFDLLTEFEGRRE